MATDGSRHMNHFTAAQRNPEHPLICAAAAAAQPIDQHKQGKVIPELETGNSADQGWRNRKPPGRH